MTISKELLDELLKGCDRPEDLLGDSRAYEGAEDQAHGTNAGSRADGPSGF